MNEPRLWNWAQAALLIGGLTALLAAVGWVLAGWVGVIWSMGLSLGVAIMANRLPARLVLRRSGATPLPRHAAPRLYAVLDILYQRAGLEAEPALFYVPSGALNAFAVGGPHDGAVAVSAGILRLFPLRLLAGVLAHEVTHLRHNDTWVMTLASSLSELTGWLATAAQILLLALLPWVLLGDLELPWLPLMLVVIAPTVATLLQLALSRNREFAADREAAHLTGDPLALAAALQRLEEFQGTWLEHVFTPRRRLRVPRWLRTHPETEERIARLRALAREGIPGTPVVSQGAWDRASRLVRPPAGTIRARRPRLFRL